MEVMFLAKFQKMDPDHDMELDFEEVIIRFDRTGRSDRESWEYALLRALDHQAETGNMLDTLEVIAI